MSGSRSLRTISCAYTRSTRVRGSVPSGRSLEQGKDNSLPWTRSFPAAPPCFHQIRPYSFSTDHLEDPKQSNGRQDARYNLQDDSIARRAELLRKVLEVKAAGRSGRRDEKGELKCRIYDSSGTLDTRGSSLRKSYICEHYGLHPRDLRKLDSNSTVIPGDYSSRFTLDACILPRDRCIVVNLLYVKALISADHIIIFDPPAPIKPAVPPSQSLPEPSESYQSPHTSIGASHSSTSPSTELLAASTEGSINTSPLKQNTETKPMEVDELHALFGKAVEEQLGRLSTSLDVGGKEGMGGGAVGRREKEAFEHRALESLLLTLLAIFTSELSLFLSRIRILLHDLSADISREELKRLLNLRSAVAGFEARVKAVNDGVERVLQNDDDLAAGYLTAKATDKPRDSEDHEELELLLENYSQHLEGIMSEVAGALSDVKSTQSVVELLLDSSRNMLMVLDLRVSIATLGMGTGALGAGLLGMNLANGYEESQPAFYGMTAFLLAASCLTMGVGWKVLSKWSKVGLSGVKGMSVRKHVGASPREVSRLMKDE